MPYITTQHLDAQTMEQVDAFDYTRYQLRRDAENGRYWHLSRLNLDGSEKPIAMGGKADLYRVVQELLEVANKGGEV